MNERWARTTWVLLAAATLVAAALTLVAHAYLGTFARYIADDFCTLSTLRRLGFLESQVNWYLTWTGRYAYTFVVTLTQVVGPALTPWLPALTLLAWGAAVVFVVRRLQGDRAPYLAAAAIASVHVFSTLRGSPNIYQSLYWQTGMITYTLPLILGAVYGAWLWTTAAGGGGPHATRTAVFAFVGAWLLGGFSETYVALQTAALTLLLLALPLWVRSARRTAAGIVAGGLAGSVAAGLTIVLAPGTAIRRDLMAAAPDLGPWIEAIVRDAYLFIARTAKGSPEAILLAILLPLLLVVLLRRGEGAALDGKRGSLAAIIGFPLVTPLLMLATIAPYEYAITSYPDGRVLITTMFVLVSGLMLWGGAVGLLVGRPAWARSSAVGAAAIVVSAIVVLGLAAASLRAATAVLAEADESRAYAVAWDTRDANLRRVPPDSELVPAASLSHMGGLAEIGRDPREWINRCLAGAYDLNSVVAK